MKVSPSLASADLLHLADEIKWLDENFGQFHIDLDDANTVNNMSFGFKMCKMICAASSSEITIHLECMKQKRIIKHFLELGKKYVLFLETDCQDDPADVIDYYKQHGLLTGINISNWDLNKAYFDKILTMTDYILVNTSHHDDPTQTCDMEMLDLAVRLAEQGKKVWIDGGVTYEIYQKVKDSKIYSAVMGRAVFTDRKLALERFCPQ